MVGCADLDTVFCVGVHADADWSVFLDLVDVLVLSLLGVGRDVLEGEELAVGLGAEFLLVHDFVDHELV